MKKGSSLDIARVSLIFAFLGELTREKEGSGFVQYESEQMNETERNERKNRV
ncbi:MAG: hypothetical protein OER96_03420 [Gammaproteobacteria bacterium]|nr:hypothetical protein [Gammaproteobacteria bacterium]